MILGDLGANVIKVEPPGGSLSRFQGPKVADDSQEETERSLQFLAYNRNKRSIVLNPSSETDRGMLLAMMIGTDFVLDSGPPSNLAAYGISFDDLKKVNPRIIYVHISPWGIDGPAANRPASDLTISAMGGQAALQGSPDRAPVRVTVPQVWRHAGAEAATAALVAHARMRATGEAQFVDLSAQCAMTWTTMNAMNAFDIQGFDFERLGSMVQLGTSMSTDPVFACADGYLVAIPGGPEINALLGFLIAENIVGDEWLEEDWETIDTRRNSGEEVTYSRDQMREALTRYFPHYTKTELFQIGLDLGITLAPIMTTADLLDFEQLKAREAWTTLQTPDGKKIKAPGAFAKPSSGELKIKRKAPRLNEHSAEIRAELQLKQPKPASVAISKNATGRPFEGLKVLDLTWVIAGPVSSRYFSDHGATVVKVESEFRPDGLRLIGPRKGDPGWNNSHFYGQFNAGKEAIRLNLKTPEGLEILKKLVSWADVLIENWAPGALARLGLSYPECSELNPKLIMMSTSLMGQDGPTSAIAGFGYHAAGMAGFYEITGWQDMPPHGPWMAYTDVIAPRFIAGLVAASIDHRERTGEGQHIDASQFEIALQFLAPELMDAQTSGYIATRLGNRSTDAAPQGMYPCIGDDQWIAIACDSDEQWMKLRSALGEPAWATNIKFNDTAGRLSNHDEIDEHLSQWTALRTPVDTMDYLASYGVPAGALQRSEDLSKDPQYLHREFNTFRRHPEIGEVPYAGIQYRIPGYESGPYRHAPLFGEHTEYVLKDRLGLSDEEYELAENAGALQ